MNSILATRSAAGTPRKVDFVIAGAQKSGTTALAAYMREHPAIYVACGSTGRRSTHFFDTEEYFQGQHVDYSIYHSFFHPKPFHKVMGEVTPIYMYWYDAPRRIWEYNPMIKIIIALRNPIERAYSHWNMMREQKRDTLSFWDALQNESERCREALPYQHRFYSYVDRGFYVAQLRRLWSYFPRENTLVLKQGSLKKNPGETLDTVFGFLGVDRVPGLDIIDIHSRPYMAPLSDRAFEHLRYTYEYEICTLERILGWDCRDWLIKGSSNSSGHG